MKIDKRLLTVDIETSPNIVADFSCGYNKTITHKQILQERKIICVAWKWYGSSRVYSAHWGVTKQDDTKLLKLLQREMAKADFVITQNGDKFDLPWLQGRALALGLKPFPKVTSLDILKMNRKAFNLNSYKLDYVAGLLNIGHKSPMEFQDWLDITVHKSMKALNKMLKYNQKDVVLTEQVFLKVLPYTVLAAPLYTYKPKEAVICETCGTDKYFKKDGHRYNKTGKKQMYYCSACNRRTISRFVEK